MPIWYASNLAHIPKQLAWATAKRGMAAHTVKAAYSSQECHRCHSVDRANRPDQSTFICVACGYRNHADRNARSEFVQPLWGSGTGNLPEQSRGQSLAPQTAWNSEEEQRVVRSTTPSPVGSLG